MIQQQLYEWITHPERLNRDTLYELRTLLARYPYFQTVRLLYLKNLFLLHDITFGEELRKAALYVADRKILFYLIEGERFTVSSFEKWITHPERLNRDTLYELRTLLARYPYFQTVRLLYLKNLFLLHDITFGEELRKAALYVADRKILFYLIEGERFTVSSFEKQDLPKEEAGLDRTLSLIDTFLSSLPEEAAAMELPMDVTTDYTSFLLHEEEHVSDDIPQMKGQNLIDNFIEKSAEEPLLPQLGIKEAAPVKNKVSEEEESEDNEEDMEDESYFTETLAKIYVKQQRYSKALEIIKKLNLKYPKKNAYFADQIRFLEKLIINTKSK